MSIIKHVHFAEFLFNALDVKVETITFEDDLFDITVDEKYDILMSVSDDFKVIKHFYIFPKGDKPKLKLKKMSIAQIINKANIIRGNLTQKDEIFDLSECVLLTE